MEVEYKIVDGFPHYRIGNNGSLWSRKLRNGKPGFADKWTQLKPRRGTHYGKPSYYYTIISDENFNQKTVKIHVLVAEAFLEPRPPGAIVCHKDNDPTNNHVSNLKWGTYKSNMEDKIQFGTDPKGEKNPRAILTEDEVPKARILKRMGLTYIELAKVFHTSKSGIRDAVNGKNWTEIEGGDWRPYLKYPKRKSGHKRGPYKKKSVI